MKSEKIENLKKKGEKTYLTIKYSATIRLPQTIKNQDYLQLI